MIRLEVNLSDSVAVLFRTLCGRHGVTMTEGIRLAVIAWREATPNELSPADAATEAEDRLQSIADLHAEWTQGSMDVVTMATEVGRVLWYRESHVPTHLDEVATARLDELDAPRQYPWRADGPSMARHTPKHLLSPKD